MTKNVQCRLRHKLTMEWIRGEVKPVDNERLTIETARIYDAIAPLYAPRLDGALWLDREIKAKRAYEMAVETLPLGQALPVQPMLYQVYEKAARQ